MRSVYTTKHRIIGIFLLLVTLLLGQFLGTSIHSSIGLSQKLNEITDDDLIDNIKSATLSLTDLFNEEEGMFLWNVQDLTNLSRYGDHSDLTNTEEGLVSLDCDQWLAGVKQDISMQYLLLKENVLTSLESIGDDYDEYLFNREWIFLTEKIVSWLYTNIAVNDKLIDILTILSDSGNGFDEFWNTFIRPKEQAFLDENIGLLTDALVLGSKILKAVEFMPYFSPQERITILFRAEMVSDWWHAINQYALHDPEFAVAGLDNSKMSQEYANWISWNDFIHMGYNDTFTVTDIYAEGHVSLTNYLYTSPQMADIYLTYIEKANARESYLWFDDEIFNYQINDPLALSISNQITQDYADHIEYVNNKILYVFDPTEELGWTSLIDRFEGYSYVWDKYFIDEQDSLTDYNHYLYNLPYAITGTRSFQGAGDIRGLMDIFNVLTHGFNLDNNQFKVDSAYKVLSTILDAQRIDGAFVLSPYYGTSLDNSIITKPLLNDATLVYPIILPDGINSFTGTMSMMEYLLWVYPYVDKYSSNLFTKLQSRLTLVLTSLGDLFLNNVNRDVFGLPQHTIIGTFSERTIFPLYFVRQIDVSINFQYELLSTDQIPNWINSYNPYTKIGSTHVYQWDYLDLLNSLFFINKEERFVEPIIDAFTIFTDDYASDNQYQITSLCGISDAIARTFFSLEFNGYTITYNDETGHYGNIIPYSYRTGVKPVTNAFSTEVPQSVSSLILVIIPLLNLNFLSDPINQIVLIGFITGILLTVAVVYKKRPKNQ
ncbi:MAG: hypothetical protein ACTSP7_03845 [Candidatus Heimdallarchaeota archaeon]